MRNGKLPLGNVVERGDELAMTNPVQGLYNQLLFDLCSDDSLIAFVLQDTEHPIIDLMQKVNTNVWRKQENFLAYVAPSGTADDDPSDATVADPCEDANQVEYGFCSFVCEGFSRIRRSTPVRDITDRDLKYCETQPIYDIYGSRVSDDFEWDAFTLATVLVQDFTNLLMTGNSGNAGQTDGILNLIDYDYENPVNNEPCKEMDSIVIDWAENTLCDFENGAPSITYNGNAVDPTITPNLTLIDIIKEYVIYTAQKISMSSVAGAFNYYALADARLISELINCWVCYTVCGRDITRMDSFEARQMLESRRAQLGRFGSVTLDFDGYNVTFIPWQWDGLYDSVDDVYHMVFMVPRIGNYPTWEIEFKDMASAIRGLELDYKEWMVSDGGRWLSWSQIDHTCYQRHMELQWRVCHRAPWTSMKILNISLSGHVLPRISFNPTSPDFIATKTPSDTAVPYSLR